MSRPASQATRVVELGTERPTATPSATLTTTRASRVLTMDARCADLFEAEAAFVVGKPLASFVELWDRRGFRTKLALLPDGGREDDWRFRLRTSAGRLVPVVATAQALSGSDGAREVRWTIVRDTVSPSPGIEIPPGSELERAVDEMRHEVSQPLAAIVAYAHGCLRRSQSGILIRGELESVLQSIAAEAVRAGDLLRKRTPKGER